HAALPRDCPAGEGHGRGAPGVRRPPRPRPGLRWWLPVLRHVGSQRRQTLRRGPGYARRSQASPDQEVSVKVVVDFDECASNAVCMGILPEVFEVRDDGYLYVLNEHPPEEFRERLREAVNGCPTGAISIEED